LAQLLPSSQPPPSAELAGCPSAIKPATIAKRKISAGLINQAPSKVSVRRDGPRLLLDDARWQDSVKAR
jgi:hypothetical protein